MTGASRAAFETAAADAAAVLGSARTRELAALLGQRRGLEHALHVLSAPDVAGVITRLYARVGTGVDHSEAAAYLRGFAAAWAAADRRVDVSTVWTGPPTPKVPSQSTASTLTKLVREARTELIAMTYSARAYPPLTAALTDALARGVRVDIVVETVSGSGGLLQGPEPASAFALVPGIHLWTWDPARRTHDRSRQHAKLAVADATVLYLGSANLTESGLRKNIEAGILIRGGTAPTRAAEHIKELQHRGDLRLLPGAPE